MLTCFLPVTHRNKVRGRQWKRRVQLSPYIMHKALGDLGLEWFVRSLYLAPDLHKRQFTSLSDRQFQAPDKTSTCQQQHQRQQQLRQKMIGREFTSRNTNVLGLNARRQGVGHLYKQGLVTLLLRWERGLGMLGPLEMVTVNGYQD